MKRIIQCIEECIKFTAKCTCGLFVATSAHFCTVYLVQTAKTQDSVHIPKYSAISSDKEQHNYVHIIMQSVDQEDKHAFYDGFLKMAYWLSFKLLPTRRKIPCPSLF